MKIFPILTSSLISVLAFCIVSHANVVIHTVTVGNPGNSGESSGAGAAPEGAGPNVIVGAVPYVYQVGKYEITAGQYTEFLNAVASTDTYGLYNSQMSLNSRGCRIERSGSPGSYSYSVNSDWANRPVNFTSWGDAARFANWMHNGQPTGLQDHSTTENGSYYMNGVTGQNDQWQFLNIERQANATWVIPTEDEWYKSAYHKNDGASGNYWYYSTVSDDIPSNDLIDPDPGNSANFRLHNDDYAIGSPYWRTEVGEFPNSESPYGTCDQGGNVWEWNESILNNTFRCLRGGSFDGDGTGNYLHAANRQHDASPTDGADDIGFRLAFVPEPSTFIFLGIAMLASIRR